MKQKHYMDIERLKPQYVDGFEVGDLIWIEEKVDGANFALRYDEETNTIKSFSRRRELDFSNNLRGAWEWSQKLDVELVKKILGNRYCVFAEWLVLHTVKYPEEKYYKPYGFDVYDLEEEKYLSQDIAKSIIESLGIEFVPVFYVGEFTSWDDVKSYLGKTEIGGHLEDKITGEGIVIKNQTKLNNPNTRLPFYTKIVCEEFCETKAHKGSKTTNIEALKKREEIIAIVETVVTKARVRKILNKFIDEGLIPENWDEHNMKTIAQNIGKEIYYDCLKEESDVVESVGSMFGKYSNSIAMKYVREILQKEH